MKALTTNRGLTARIVNAVRNSSVGGQGCRVVDLPTPSISDNEILVKVSTIALNPTDFKHLDIIAPPNSILGCDYSGTVHQVGNAARGRWNVGDRVAGTVHGGLYPDRGAFAEFLKIDADLAWKVPENITDAEAATYGVSAVTAMLNVNVRHGLPFVTPDGNKTSHAEVIFIYAGSTSAGLYHIQLAKAAGCKVITTASPRSFELVRRYGADAVYDYNATTLAEDIVQEYPSISKAVDCFSEGKSTSICAQVLGRKGGKVITLLPNGKPKAHGVAYELVMSYTAFGNAFQWLPPLGPKFDAQPTDRQALARFYEILPQVTDLIKPIPTWEERDGFDGIIEGLDKLRTGQVVGGKLVVKLCV